MAAEDRMRETKGTILSLLLIGYGIPGLKLCGLQGKILVSLNYFQGVIFTSLRKLSTFSAAGSFSKKAIKA